MSTHHGVRDVGGRVSGTDSVGGLLLVRLSSHIGVVVGSRHCGTDSGVHLLLDMKSVAEGQGLRTMSSHDGVLRTGSRVSGTDRVGHLLMGLIVLAESLAVDLKRELVLILGSGVVSNPEHKLISIIVC